MHHLGDSLIHEYLLLVIAFQCAIYSGPEAQGVIFVNRSDIVVSNGENGFALRSSSSQWSTCSH